ncbi:MAG TPA: hypothetical protein DEH78_31135 [Solibacterales bacterium]|nr:hypothetical protein [Bryobacterales bacterium]
MKPILRNLSFVAAFGLMAAYVFLALRGPQGLPSLLEKRRQIQQLQEQNQNLKVDVERKQERIRLLKTSREMQELEIRRRLKLQREGDTTIFLPEGKKAAPK